MHIAYASSAVSMTTFANRLLVSRSLMARSMTAQSVTPPFSPLNSNISSPFVPGSVVRNRMSGNVEKKVVFPNFGLA
jgi:hypothetical protein